MVLLQRPTAVVDMVVVMEEDMATPLEEEASLPGGKYHTAVPSSVHD